VDVKVSKAGLEEMLKVAQGRRDVPVILEDGKVTVGFGGS
jgi:glutaredoxin